MSLAHTGFVCLAKVERHETLTVFSDRLDQPWLQLVTPAPFTVALSTSQHLLSKVYSSTLNSAA